MHNTVKNKNCRLNDNIGKFLNNKFGIDLNAMIYKINGLFFTLLAVALAELLHILGLKTMGIGVIFIAAVVYSILTGGVVLGIISAVITLLYSIYFYSIPERIFTYSVEDYIYVSVSIGVMACIALMVGFVQEKLKRELRKVMERQEQLERAEALSLIMVCHTTLDGHMLKITPAFCSMLGYTEEELFSITLKDIIHPEDYKNQLANLSLLINGKIKSFDMEERYICKNGEIIWVYINTSIVTDDDGKPIHFLSYLMNITERKKMDKLKKDLNEAMEYDRIKTEFFANISHEFRTPINVIMGSVQLLESYHKDGVITGNDDIINKYNKIMKQNCYRLLRLINNLIDITKIDAGFFAINLQNYNIVSVVEDITMSVADYIQSKSLTLIFDTEVEEKIIACDPDTIERIMLNLLSNAIKFTEPGGSIMVSIYDKIDSVAVSVKDTGIGIPEDKLGIIFERFRQVDKSLTRRHEGSGIGLSLAKSLIEAHGGSIYVKSKYGEGSEFIFELPAKVVEESNNMVQRNSMYCVIEKTNIELSDIY